MKNTPTPEEIANGLVMKNDTFNGYKTLCEAFLTQLGKAKEEMSDLEIEMLYTKVKRVLVSPSNSSTHTVPEHWALVG